MPVRTRITLVFSLLVFIILGLVCTGIFYFSYQARIANITTRLVNRAITTARLLSQREVFDRALIQRIDSSTTIALKHKSVQAYDYQDRRIYQYSDVPADTLAIDQNLLDDARVRGSYYFTIGNKEAVAYHYTDNQSRIVIVVAGEDTEGKESLRSLLNILLLSFLIGNIFVLIIGYFFSRVLLRPITRISEDAAEISAQNLARRINTGSTKDEWFQLSNTLNNLLNRLQESFELQRRFISNASHELSTPLTAISSQLEVSLQRERDADEYRNVMQSIYQDVQYMNKLTQTLLEFAKASGDPGGLELSPVRIDEIILGLPAEVSKINPLYAVTIQFDDLPDEEDHLVIYGNETLLLTAIKNMVINACKYSDDHHAVVMLEVRKEHISIWVRDNGPGIAKEALTNIFQPFFRVEEHRGAGGFGLGLSLADRIIRIHKGTIEVSSTVGEGTLFHIMLPSILFTKAS